MTEPKILFATPAYGNMVTAAYARSCLVTMEELTRAGIGNDWLIPEQNDSLVHRARMEITKEFLDRKDFTHLFWIDADIEFSPEDVAKIWNLQTDVACGVYAMKHADKQWFAAWKDGALVHDLDRWPGPTEVDYCGTGFLLLSRRVLESIYDGLIERAKIVESLAARIRSELVLSADEEAALAQMAGTCEPHYEGDRERVVPALFMTPIWNGGLESEDYHLCRLAREAGFKIIMDPTVRLGHWGQHRFGR